MRSLAVASLAAVLSCCMAAVVPVVRFEQPTHFAYHSCSPNDNATVVINTLSVAPDPIPEPGEIYVTFSITVKDTIHHHLKAEVDQWVKVDNVWIYQPCIVGFGSCTYDNVCDMLKGQDSCPRPFDKHKLPCKCPFKQGTYYLPVSSFHVGYDSYASRDYRVKVQLSAKGQFAACYFFTFSAIHH